MTLIRDTKKVTRAIDFSGLKRSKGMSKDSAYASDIDCIMEFDDKHLIMIEIKEKGKSLPMGQDLLLSRMANRWGEYALVIYATHSPDIEGNVTLDQCDVVKIFNKSTGWTAREGYTLMNYLWLIGEKWNIQKLKRDE